MGLQFKAEIFLKSFSNKYEVEDEIQDLKKNIREYEKQVAMFVSCNPKSFIPDRVEDGVSFLKNRINEIFELYKEDLNSLNKLKLLRDYLHENPDVDVKKLSV